MEPTLSTAGHASLLTAHLSKLLTSSRPFVERSIFSATLAEAESEVRTKTFHQT